MHTMCVSSVTVLNSGKILELWVFVIINSFAEELCKEWINNYVSVCSVHYLFKVKDRQTIYTRLGCPM